MTTREALAALVNRLDAVHADAQYQSVWQLYMIHGGDYTDGPKYDKELEAARAALVELDRAKEVENQYAEVLKFVFNDPSESHEELMKELAAWERHADANVKHLDERNALLAVFDIRYDKEANSWVGGIEDPKVLSAGSTPVEAMQAIVLAAQIYMELRKDCERLEFAMKHLFIWDTDISRHRIYDTRGAIDEAMAKGKAWERAELQIKRTNGTGDEPWTSAPLPEPGDDAWWRDVNRGRGRLIDKSIAGTITEAEREYLNQLNQLADSRVGEMAPRPHGRDNAE